jgi:hypothetical protein
LGSFQISPTLAAKVCLIELYFSHADPMQIPCSPPLQSGNADLIGGLLVGSYFVGKDEKTWTKARDFCRRWCGDLVSIETKRELEVVLGEMKVEWGQWYGWVGAKRVYGTDDFKWLSGTRLKYDDEAWRRGEPNGYNENEDCLEFDGSNRPYNDLRCDRYRRPICEMTGSIF